MQSADSRKNLHPAGSGSSGSRTPHDNFGSASAKPAPLPPRPPTPVHAWAPPKPPLPTAAPAPPPLARAPQDTVVENGRLPEAGRVVGAVLEYRAEDDPGRVHPLREGRNRVGRGERAGIVLEDTRASREHGWIFVLPDGVRFQDTSSTGSFVDGRPVHGDGAPLGHGSEIRVGSVRLVVLLGPG